MIILNSYKWPSQRKKALTPSWFLGHLKNLLPRFFVCSQVSAISLTSPHLGQSISGNPVTQSTGNSSKPLALPLDPRLRADKACPMYAAASERARPVVGVGSEASDCGLREGACDRRPRGERRTARRTRRMANTRRCGGEVDGKRAAMQAERRPYVAGAGAGEQGERGGVDSTVRVF